MNSSLCVLLLPILKELFLSDRNEQEEDLEASLFSPSKSHSLPLSLHAVLFPVAPIGDGGADFLVSMLWIWIMPYEVRTKTAFNDS